MSGICRVPPRDTLYGWAPELETCQQEESSRRHFVVSRPLDLLPGRGLRGRAGGSRAPSPTFGPNSGPGLTRHSDGETLINIERGRFLLHSNPGLLTAFTFRTSLRRSNSRLPGVPPDLRPARPSGTHATSWAELGRWIPTRAASAASSTGTARPPTSSTCGASVPPGRGCLGRRRSGRSRPLALASDARSVDVD